MLILICLGEQLSVQIYNLFTFIFIRQLRNENRTKEFAASEIQKVYRGHTARSNYFLFRKNEMKSLDSDRDRKERVK